MLLNWLIVVSWVVVDWGVGKGDSVRECLPSGVVLIIGSQFEQWPFRERRQSTHHESDLTQEQALQRPLPLYRQQTGISPVNLFSFL